MGNKGGGQGHVMSPLCSWVQKGSRGWSAVAGQRCAQYRTCGAGGGQRALGGGAQETGSLGGDGLRLSERRSLAVAVGLQLGA